MTLADQLARRGYTNYLVGKWHLGHAKHLYHPLNRGFHHFFGVLGNKLNITYCQTVKVHDYSRAVSESSEVLQCPEKYPFYILRWHLQS